MDAKSYYCLINSRAGYTCLEQCEACSQCQELTKTQMQTLELALHNRLQRLDYGIEKGEIGEGYFKREVQACQELLALINKAKSMEVYL